jgi:hypothetical protein
MGYMSTGHETLILDGPVDQDRITTVARDCILAFVECQVQLVSMEHLVRGGLLKGKDQYS